MADGGGGADPRQLAIPLLEEAAGGHVEGLIGAHRPARRGARDTRARAVRTQRRSFRRCRRACRTGCIATCHRAWNSSAYPSRSDGQDVRPPAADPALAHDSPRSSGVMPRGARDPSLPGRRRSRRTRPLPSVPLAAGNRSGRRAARRRQQSGNPEHCPHFSALSRDLRRNCSHEAEMPAVDHGSPRPRRVHCLRASMLDSDDRLP